MAALVAGLALERNAATLLLRNTLDVETDSDEEDAPPPQPTRVLISPNISILYELLMEVPTRRTRRCPSRRGYVSLTQPPNRIC